MKPLLCALICLAGLGCGGDGDDDGAATTLSGVCVRNDAQGSFCIDYVDFPEGNLGAIQDGCSNNWGGAFTTDGSCPSDTLVGTCELTGGATGGAASAVMEVYEPTDAVTAEQDICGSDGDWTPAS